MDQVGEDAVDGGGAMGGWRPLLTGGARTLSRRWTRPTGNCRPARAERDVGFFLSCALLSTPRGAMVPLAPLPARPCVRGARGRETRQRRAVWRPIAGENPGGGLWGRGARGAGAGRRSARTFAPLPLMVAGM